MKIVPAGYGLDDRVISVRFPSGERKFSLLQCAQTFLGIHPASTHLDGEAFSLGIKRPGREANLPTASSGQY